MPQTEIMDEYNKLPPIEQKQVKDYILFLRSRYQKPLLSNRKKSGDVKEEPFIGIWQDREDLADSRTWLRTIRKSEWRVPNV
jgi:hypothetical protein